jgi:hypothetical protein
MVSNLDIWRAANLLIRRHSAEAEPEAARLPTPKKLISVTEPASDHAPA